MPYVAYEYGCKGNAIVTLARGCVTDCAKMAVVVRGLES
jgi:hypothetical protein